MGSSFFSKKGQKKLFLRQIPGIFVLTEKASTSFISVLFTKRLNILVSYTYNIQNEKSDLESRKEKL